MNTAFIVFVGLAALPLALVVIGDFLASIAQMNVTSEHQVAYERASAIEEISAQTRQSHFAPVDFEADDDSLLLEDIRETERLRREIAELRKSDRRIGDLA